jgi:hypothetical protein
MKFDIAPIICKSRSYKIGWEYVPSMNEMKQKLNKKHWRSIKNVHVHLVSGDVALDSFRKFNNAKDTLQNDNESGYK